MTDIPERAAWLDKKVSWVPHPSTFELDRLGIRDGEIFLTDKQVGAKYDKVNGTTRIMVRTVEILEMDEESGQASFVFNGMTNLAQPWDLGGANLDPQVRWEEE